MANTAQDQVEPGLSGLQLGLLALLVLASLGSVGLRVYKTSEEKGATTGVPAASHGLTQDGAKPAPGAPTPLERSLPYVTEASLFGLIGFALGFATRKFVKVGLVLLALFFVGLQALVWTGTASVDWGGLIGRLNDWIFNLKENESMAQFLTRRIPSGGAMLAGYLLGFQRA